METAPEPASGGSAATPRTPARTPARGSGGKGGSGGKTGASTKARKPAARSSSARATLAPSVAEALEELEAQEKAEQEKAEREKSGREKAAPGKAGKPPAEVSEVVEEAAEEAAEEPVAETTADIEIEAELEADPDPQAEAEIEPEPKAEQDAEAESEPEPEPEPEPQTEAELDSEAEPEPEAESETQAEPEPEPVSETEPASGSEPEHAAPNPVATALAAAAAGAAGAARKAAEVGGPALRSAASGASRLVRRASAATAAGARAAAEATAQWWARSRAAVSADVAEVREQWLEVQAARAERALDRAELAQVQAEIASLAEPGSELARAERTAPEPQLSASLEFTPAPSGTALSARGLSKGFGTELAVDGVDLDVPAGSFYGIVGPNGAGKTTLLSMITGLLRPDAGTIEVHGADVWTDPVATKRDMGILPDRLRLFDRLTGAQLLHYSAMLRGLDRTTARRRTADLASVFGMESSLGRQITDYSTGMTKKVALAASMIHAPRLLVLDEPLESVDPVSAATVTEILRKYVEAGGTVLMTSHSMDLVQRLCDRVAVIVDGRLIAEGTVAEVRDGATLQERFVELAGRKTVEELEWLHGSSN